MRIKKYYKLIKVDYEDTEYFRIKNISDTAGVFTITRNGNPSTADLKYSLDGVNWTTADLSADFSLSVSAGANLYLKGTNTSGFNKWSGSYHKMSMDVNHSIGGNIMSIVNEENYATVTKILNNCFIHLFDGDTYLINAGDVNFGSVTSINESGLGHMFSNCTSLTTSPDLSNVTSIGRYGIAQMFYNCTSLTTPSNLSNVTSIVEYGCDRMYQYCSSLTTGSDLSNVTSIGGDGCNSMYYYCTSLSSATAPNISTWNTNIFNTWLSGVASTGVVRKPAGLEIPTDDTSGIPTGWTTVDY